MVRVTGGMVVIGTDEPLNKMDGEGPRRKVKMSDFFINKYEVSNNEFREFVDDTGYVTESEKFGWSFVFESAIPDEIKENITEAVAATPWWLPVQESYWYQPVGPGSDVFSKDADTGLDRGNYPVVQVSWNDANAYCQWKYEYGCLPTEAQWELAARGGSENLIIETSELPQNYDMEDFKALEKRKYTRYPWGTSLVLDNGTYMSNTFQGKFPSENTALDGYEFMAPVDSFPAQNSLGLHHIIGNVWEWTADWWEVQHRAHKHYKTVTERIKSKGYSGELEETSMRMILDPSGPPQGTDKVKKGGSFLCHESYCNRYRIAARTQSTPDSATFNLGFRCAMNINDDSK